MAGSAIGAAPPTMPLAAWAHSTRTNARLRKDRARSSQGPARRRHLPFPLRRSPHVPLRGTGPVTSTGRRWGPRPAGVISTGTPLTAALPDGTSSADGGISTLVFGPGPLGGHRGAGAGGPVAEAVGKAHHAAHQLVGHLDAPPRRTPPRGDRDPVAVDQVPVGGVVGMDQQRRTVTAASSAQGGCGATSCWTGRGAGRSARARGTAPPCGGARRSRSPRMSSWASSMSPEAVRSTSSRSAVRRAEVEAVRVALDLLEGQPARVLAVAVAVGAGAEA